MAGQDAEVAFDARRINLVDQAGEQFPLGRDQEEMQFLGHP